MAGKAQIQLTLTLFWPARLAFEAGFRKQKSTDARNAPGVMICKVTNG
jgi:hypothetical protein